MQVLGVKSFRQLFVLQAASSFNAVIGLLVSLRLLLNIPVASFTFDPVSFSEQERKTGFCE